MGREEDRPLARTSRMHVRTPLSTVVRRQKEIRAWPVSELSEPRAMQGRRRPVRLMGWVWASFGLD